MSSNISVGVGSASDSPPDDSSSILALIVNGGRVKWSSDLSPLSVLLWNSNSIFPSLKCAKVIIFTVFYYEDVAYGIYDTDGCIAIASESGCDVYAKKL